MASLLKFAVVASGLAVAVVGFTLASNLKRLRGTETSNPSYQAQFQKVKLLKVLFGVGVPVFGILNIILVSSS